MRKIYLSELVTIFFIGLIFSTLVTPMVSNAYAKVDWEKVSIVDILEKIAEPKDRTNGGITNVDKTRS